MIPASRDDPATALDPLEQELDNIIRSVPASPRAPYIRARLVAGFPAARRSASRRLVLLGVTAALSLAATGTAAATLRPDFSAAVSGAVDQVLRVIGVEPGGWRPVQIPPSPSPSSGLSDVPSPASSPTPGRTPNSTPEATPSVVPVPPAGASPGSAIDGPPPSVPPAAEPSIRPWPSPELPSPAGISPPVPTSLPLPSDGRPLPILPGPSDAFPSRGQ